MDMNLVTVQLQRNALIEKKYNNYIRSILYHKEVVHRYLYNYYNSIPITRQVVAYVQQLYFADVKRLNERISYFVGQVYQQKVLVINSMNQIIDSKQSSINALNALSKYSLITTTPTSSLSMIPTVPKRIASLTIQINPDTDQVIDKYEIQLTIRSKDNATFKCEHCNKTYHKKKDLINHLYYHTDKYACTICGQRTGSHYLRRQHEATHNNVRPFKCNICERSFKREKDLRGHSNTDNGCRLYQLSKSKKASKKCDNNKNNVVDKAYKCYICQKGYSKKKSLNAHKNTHTDRFRCLVCNRGHISESALKRHMFTHFDEKLFICERCNKSYRTIKGLNEHKCKSD